MDYIYDIVLNFQNDYYDFYEWKKTDKVINVKKIPVYLVNNQNYLNLKYNEVIIDNTKLPNNTKMFLATNGQEVMGLLLDNQGKIIKKSSLLLEESEEVLNEKDTIKALPLKYIKNISKPHNIDSRIHKEKIKYINKYLSNIDIKKDEYLLKYIYYETYKKEENNVRTIKEEINKLISNDINKIYNAIKKITIELKM